MAPPTRKQLDRGAYGYGKDDENYSFLKIDRDPWEASASGHGYNARFNDDDGYDRGAGAYTASSDAGLRDKQSDEYLEVAHERLADLIDNQKDMGSGSKIFGGGGPVSRNAPDNSPGWKGSGRKGPRYAPKTGPRTNNRDY